MFIALIEMLFWKLKWLIDAFSDDQIFYVICIDGCNNSATANSNSATFQIMFNDIFSAGETGRYEYNNITIPSLLLLFILKLVKQVKVSGTVNLLSFHSVS